MTKVFRYNWDGVAKSDYIAYTDGSCNNLSPYGEGGSAYVLTKDGDIILQRAKGFMHTTNNRMELLAIISALFAVERGSSIEVRTDSQYCITYANSRVRSANGDMSQLFDEACKGKKVLITWVRGHNGTELNELCDRLADAERDKMRIAHNIPIYNANNSPKVRK